MKRLLLSSTLAITSMAGAALAGSHSISACLITKTDTNPFFVKMKEGATKKAKELDITLKTYAGKVDGDHETQVQAIETCIADGADGILLTASDTSSITTSVKQARDAGLLVIALDTPLEPIDAADATFATDNFLAGELGGKWAAAQLGADAANAKIGMLDLAISQPSVGVLRDQGFLTGFGIDIKDPGKWGDEDDPRIVGHDVTAGNEEGGRRAMENLLANTHELKGAIKTKIEANKELGLLSKRLATILLDCPVTFNESDYELSTPDVEKTDALFNELEFRRMAEQFDAIFKKGGADSGNNPSDAALYKKPQPKNDDQFDLFASATTTEAATEIHQQFYSTLENTAHSYQIIQGELGLKLLLQNNSVVVTVGVP